MKYDRKRLKSERLQRQARLEDDLRKKRLQTVCAADFTRDKVGEEEEDEGEVRKRRDEKKRRGDGLSDLYIVLYLHIHR